MSLKALTGRALARDLSASGWADAVTQCLDQVPSGFPRDEALAETLFSYLPNPPPSVISYISQALSLGLITFCEAVKHLLLSRDIASLPFQTLLRLCQAILHDSIDNEHMSKTIPSQLGQSPADIGPSTDSSTKWTISLLMPLLHLCITNPSPPVIDLVSRILWKIEPYPAPPFDVGLDASRLVGSLPDIVSIPLRQSLHGLMTDLAISEGSTQQAQAEPPSTSTSLPLSNIQAGNSNGPEISSITLPETFEGVLSQTMAFLLASYRGTYRHDRNAGYASNPPSPPDGLKSLLRLFWGMTSTEDDLLGQILDVFLQRLVPEAVGLNQDSAEAALLLMDGLPVLLRWWKDQANGPRPFPDDLENCLKYAFNRNKKALEEHESWQKTNWVTITAGPMGETGEGFHRPEGWFWASIRENMVRKLAHLELLTAAQVKDILPEMVISEPWMIQGEHLMYSLERSGGAYREAFAFVVIYAPGGMRDLAFNVVDVIQESPGRQAPYAIFDNTSSSAPLLACLAAYCPPATLLDIATARLLEKSESEVARSEDPQGSMTRYGEGVIFVESFAAQYKLPLPKRLREARTALSWGELSTEEKGMMKRWVKALFGPDGIDDETLLSTPPETFCRLGCSIFQQAIAAAATGQMDLDTLHSGLSYFSQSLLSWSLSGIISWLCKEAHRLGPLSALHLDVLQNLLGPTGVSRSIWRVIGPEVAGLLVPHAGLGPVLRSSGFDVETIKTQLGDSGISTEIPLLPTNTLITLRSDIQMLRSIELAPSSWPSSIIKAVHTAMLYEDPMSCLETITSEVISTPMDFRSQDPVIAYVAQLLVLPCDSADRILLEPLIKKYIPALFDSAVFPYRLDQFHSLARLVRIALLLLRSMDAERAKSLGGYLSDEVACVQSRGVAGGEASRKRKAVGGPLPLSPAAAACAGLLAHAVDKE